MRAGVLLVVAMLLIVVAVVVALPVDDARTPSSSPASSPPPPVQEANGPRYPPVRYRDSRALGRPAAGRLVRATRLPALGPGFRTWDPIVRRSPSRGWRRNATDQLVRMVVRVARRYRVREPAALPMLVGDLSRPHGGDFGPQYGFVGHSTHQNGLDVDVYYPRRDRRQSVPRTVAQVDLRRSQRLVDLFVAAGAQTVLVGPNVGLRGPPGVVKPYVGHDNHLHVRIAKPG